MSISGLESYQHYIRFLKRNNKIDNKVKRFLIRKIYDKVFPNRDRIIVEIENWNDEPPFKIRIDSQNRRCFDCGGKAYYVLYNIRNLPKFGWRLCYRHISEQARAVLAEYYRCYKRI